MWNEAKEIYYLEYEGETVAAWTCPCGKDEPDEKLYLVEWRKPDNGIKFSMCHESCLETVEEIEND